MPRNQAGTYSLPDGNPVESGTTITSDWANSTMDDIADALTGSMPRDGSAPFVGPVSLVDGSETAPGLRFTRDARTGLYRKPDGAMAVTVAGRTIFEFYSNAAVVPSGKTLVLKDAPASAESAVNRAYVDSRIGTGVLSIFGFEAALGQTVFTGTDVQGRVLLYNAVSTLVSLNGALLIPSIDFTFTDSSTITLATGTVCDKDVLLVIELSAATGPAGPVGPQGPAGMTELDGPSLDGFLFNATEGQKVFTGLDANGKKFEYAAGGLLGFINGLYAPLFVETDSITVEFYAPTVAGDVVTFVEVTRAAGLKGDKGDTGEKGETGTAGETGATGPMGPMGPQGPTGGVGAQGPAGETGAAGPAGADSTIAGPAGPQGPKGDAGTGITMLGVLGSTAELPATGNEGDAYLIDQHLWMWAGDQWVDAGPVQGPAGATGPAGVAGPPGEVGPAGATGPAGADSTVAGPQGIQGETGPAGPAGPAGPTGADSTVAGPAGLDGAVGPAGPPGADGAPGAQGPAGLDSQVPGPQGPPGLDGAVGPQGPAGDAAGAIPVGLISMWFGAIETVPGGWALCDGLNGTPDLRDKFVMGAGLTYPVGSVGGAASIALTTDHLPTHAHSGTSDGVSTYHTHNFTAQTGGHSNDHVHNGSTDLGGDHAHSFTLELFGNGQDEYRSDPSASDILQPGRWYSGATDGGGNHAHIVNTNGVSADHSHAVSGATDAQGEHSHTFNTNAIGGGAAFAVLNPYYALAYIMKL